MHARQPRSHPPRVARARHDHVHPPEDAHAPDHDHNHAGTGALHSHPVGAAASAKAELADLAGAFIDAFRKADDKASYLRIAGIPTSILGEDGLAQHLVDVAIWSGYQVATASPGFASLDLVHLPFPGSMIKARETMTFTYVSLTSRRDVSLVEFLSSRFAEES